MALKVKAQEKLQKIGTHAGNVMSTKRSFTPSLLSCRPSALELCSLATEGTQEARGDIS